MDQRIAKQWVEELRSGKWEQGQCFLRSKNPEGVPELCCLGVLCEIAVTEGVITREESTDWRPYAYYSGETALPPNSVIEWAGIVSDGTINPWRVPLPEDTDIESHWDDGTVPLSALNDEYDFTFHQIADLVEKTWITEENA